MTFYETGLARMDQMNGFAPDAIRRLKFELLGWGLTATDRAWEEVARSAKYPQQVRSGASNGLDVVLPGGVWVNAPVFSRDQEPRAPVLDLAEDGFSVSGSEIVAPIEVAPRPAYYDRKCSDGTPMREVGQMSGDRIGFGLSTACYFWRKDRRCKFCSIGLNGKNELPDKPLELILETLDAAVRDPVLPARHLLLSGGTPPGPDRGTRKFAAFCGEIKKRFPLRVYVMAVPPADHHDLEALFDAGVDEIALNLEVYNEEICRTMAPGKHRELGRERYLQALGRIRDYWQAPDVRSLLIAGIEPTKDTLAGVECLMSIEVMPILSVFRPLPGTMLADHPKPSPDELETLFRKSLDLSKDHGIALGPSCGACQNNTVAFSGSSSTGPGPRPWSSFANTSGSPSSTSPATLGTCASS